MTKEKLKKLKEIRMCFRRVRREGAKFFFMGDEYIEALETAINELSAEDEDEDDLGYGYTRTEVLENLNKFKMGWKKPDAYEEDFWDSCIGFIKGQKEGEKE